MLRRTVALLFSTCLTFAVSAQNPATPAQDPEYLIEIKTGKKVLNADQIELAPTTPVAELLQMFPELLTRGGDLAISNYDVQVNDVSMTTNKNTVLTQYKLADIKSIEVSSNPSTSQQKNGQGGVIKLKLKNLDDGVSGSASLHVNSIFRAQPGVMVNYQKDKWTLRSTFFMEYGHPFNEVSITETILPKEYRYVTDSLNSHNGYEALNLDAVYKPDKKSKLHLWAMECLNIKYKSTNSTITRNLDTHKKFGEEKYDAFNYLLGANYTYEYEASKFETEWTLSGSPTGYSRYKYNVESPAHFKNWTYDAVDREVKFTGLIKYSYKFVPTKPHNKAILIIGANMNNTPDDYNHDYSYIPENTNGESFPQSEALSSQNASLYLSPYIESDNEFGIWFLKAGLRYQHYNNYFNVTEVGSSTKNENYFTAFVNLGCQVAPHHHLSMILDRSVNRMQPYQIYPFKIFWPDLECFCEGNPSLLPISVHNVSLNYITDFTVNDKYFTFDTEFKYINSDKLITSDKEDDVMSFNNDGRSNIFVTNFLFIFSYKALSLSFTANYFNNTTFSSKGNNTYNYFNLSFVPIVNFGNGWNASLKLTYNSPIYTQTSRLSDYFYTVTRFAKSWEKFTVYLQMSDNFHETAQDEFFGTALSETKYYNLYYPNLELGFRFKF